jgi:hypothetical protein
MDEPMQQAAMHLSPSMQQVMSSFQAEEAISSWQLLRALFRIHGEYGNDIAGRLAEDPGPPTVIRKTIAVWLAELHTLMDSVAGDHLHGRLAVFGICALDPHVRAHLENAGFLDALRAELEDPFAALTPQNVLLAGAISDGVSRDARDLLDIEKEVRTIAHVLASKRVAPPLSLGLFGDWGTGKTFFITKLQAYISDIAGHFAKLEKQQDQISEWCTRVVQIEFNAWHYSDSNLWATLVSRIHEALRDEISPEEDLKQKLQQEVAQARGAAQEARVQLELAEQRVRAANENLEKTQKKLEERQQTLTGMIGNIGLLLREDDALRGQLQKASAAIGAPQAALTYDALRDLNGQLTTTVGRASAIARSMVGTPQLIFLVAAILGAPFLVGILLENTTLVADRIGRSIIELASAVAGAATWVMSYLARGTKHLDTIQAAVTRAEDARARAIKDDDRTRGAASEVTLARTEEAAARQALVAAQEELQQLQSELSELAPERRLLRLLEDRTRSAAYTKHLGIISLIREDFDAISKLLIQLEKDRTNAQERPPVQRIILYIDDLDRCRPDRVVEVLEAVHMLLAFPIFTVIVGVDPRWLRQSLLERYPRNLSLTGNENDEEATSSTPQNYLEKIFQIPFALRRVEKEGYQSLVSDLLQPPQGLMTQRTQPAGSPAEREQSPAGAGDSPAAAHDRAPLTSNFRPVAAQQLEFTTDEKTHIENLWPLFTTPRSVKRFINTYRLLRVAVEPPQRRAFENGEYQVALMLLAIVTSSPNEVYVFQQTLAEWCRRLDPAERARYWQWGELFGALRHELVTLDKDWSAIDAAIATVLQHGFNAPFRLDDAVSWLQRVSRYTFAVMAPPAGATAPARRAADRATLVAEITPAQTPIQAIHS